jgi:hypothetical protein
MARAALRLDTDDLAKLSGIQATRLARFEDDGQTVDAEALERLRRTLETAGIVFLEPNGEGAGIRLRSSVRDEGLRPEELTSENDS